MVFIQILIVKEVSSGFKAWIWSIKKFRITFNHTFIDKEVLNDFQPWIWSLKKFQMVLTLNLIDTEITMVLNPKCDRYRSFSLSDGYWAKECTDRRTDIKTFTVARVFFEMYLKNEFDKLSKNWWYSGEYPIFIASLVF